MGRGGARNRGPGTPHRGSEKWLRWRANALVLPAEGYGGEVPNFPLPNFTKREIEMWRWAWRTPQAAVWAQDEWRWRTVALWVRWSVRCEKRDASAAVAGQVNRLADQIGLTPAGLRENGWVVEPLDPDAPDADVLSFPPGTAPTAERRRRDRFPTRRPDGGGA